MLNLLIATWLALPIAPLNPLEQDTLPSTAVHFAVGFDSPSATQTIGPNLSIFYEMRMMHPLIIRGGIEYGYDKINSILYPKGNVHTASFALETLYYRGTSKLMGFIGGGAVFANHWFSPNSEVSDSLFALDNTTEVKINNQFGYRIIFGLRFKKSYSVEVSITELKPDLIKTNDLGDHRLDRISEQLRTGGFRVLFGYMIPLSRY